MQSNWCLHCFCSAVCTGKILCATSTTQYNALQYNPTPYSLMYLAKYIAEQRIYPLSGCILLIKISLFYRKGPYHKDICTLGRMTSSMISNDLDKKCYVRTERFPLERPFICSDRLLPFLKYLWAGGMYAHL